MRLSLLETTSAAPTIPATITKTSPAVTVRSQTDDNRTKKPTVLTTTATVDSAPTKPPVVIIPGNMTEPPYNVATDNNTTQKNMVKPSSEASHAVGAITGIVIGIIVFLVTCIALVSSSVVISVTVEARYRMCNMHCGNC